MAVRIRMKRLGRRHRPFFRICAMDARTPRDGRAIEELGTYDPMVPETDRRVHLNMERVNYWLSVGAQPSQKVAVLIKKYGDRPPVEEAVAAQPVVEEPVVAEQPAEQEQPTAEESAEAQE